MFHLGKVIMVIRESKEVIASDQSVQAFCEMWDDNKITLNVDPAISKEIKDGDYVLVDYTVKEFQNPPVPKQIITKILRGKIGQVLWEEYKDFFEKRKEKDEGRAIDGQKYLR